MEQRVFKRGVSSAYCTYYLTCFYRTAIFKTDFVQVKVSACKTAVMLNNHFVLACSVADNYPVRYGVNFRTNVGNEG